MLTSTRRQIIYPNPIRVDSADVPRDILAVVNALEADVVYGQGTLALRPTSTGGSPGLQGRIYCASDQTPKQFFWDNGTGWDPIGAITVSSINRQGTLTLRPAANAVDVGTKYFATDQVVEYISDGSVWTRIGIPAGACVEWYSNVVPTGWVRYDAGNLPSAVGIYADLYAHLSSTLATPDVRGRVTVAVGTHADNDAVLDNDGVTVNSRRMRHKHTTAHTLTLPDHVHNYDQYAGGALTGGGYNSGAPQGGVAGTFPTGNPTTHPAIPGAITVGPQTGSEPVDSAAFITAYKIAKL